MMDLQLILLNLLIILRIIPLVVQLCYREATLENRNHASLWRHKRRKRRICEYNGNLLTKKTTYNRDQSEYIEESYLYDGFGNIIEKTIENPSNNDDVQAATTKSQYEDKGRFVIKNG